MPYTHTHYESTSSPRGVKREPYVRTETTGINGRKIVEVTGGNTYGTSVNEVTIDGNGTHSIRTVYDEETDTWTTQTHNESHRSDRRQRRDRDREDRERRRRRSPSAEAHRGHHHSRNDGPQGHGRDDPRSDRGARHHDGPSQNRDRERQPSPDRYRDNRPPKGNPREDYEEAHHHREDQHRPRHRSPHGDHQSRQRQPSPDDFEPRFARDMRQKMERDMGRPLGSRRPRRRSTEDTFNQGGSYNRRAAVSQERFVNPPPQRVAPEPARHHHEARPSNVQARQPSPPQEAQEMSAEDKWRQVQADWLTRTSDRMQYTEPPKRGLRDWAYDKCIGRFSDKF